MAERGGVYVRVNVDSAVAALPYNTASADQVGREDPAITLIFLDLVTRDPTSSEMSDRLTSAIQDQAHLIATSDRVLIRWPWMSGPERAVDADLILSWIARLKGDASGAVISDATQVGVHQHVVGGPGHTFWSGSAPDNESELLAHARAIEIHALLRRAGAIWEPRTYHFRLPNGQHVDSFVRLADAIHSPRDALVLSSWLTPRLSNGMGLVVDNGSLTPILLQLEAFLERFGWQVGKVSILDSYPSGRSAVRGTIEQAIPDFGTAIAGIQSVSSSGTLRRLFADELERAADSFGTTCSLDILVDRSKSGRDCGVLTPSPPEFEVSWLGLGDSGHLESAGQCLHCKNPTKAHFVGIDTRTYAEMALPEPYRAMPDIHYAEEAHLFWERAQITQAVAIEASPHPMSKIARGKRVALPVRISFELFAQPDGLIDCIRERVAQMRPAIAHFQQTKLVVVNPGDVKRARLPDFIGGETDLRDSLQKVLEAIDLDPLIPILATDDPGFAQKVCELAEGDHVLLFSWGTVTGLSMRHLKQAVANALGSDENVVVNGLVLHSRPSAPQEWTAAQNQLKPGELIALWTSCFPWDSPLSEEARLLDRAALDPTTLSARASIFLTNRMTFLQYHSTFLGELDDWSPRFAFANTDADPRYVFWGMSPSGRHQKMVRGRSLYGKGLDCLTAYSAIGSVVQFTRNNVKPEAAPRWVMFDMNRLVRSYFDAVIVSAVVRWLRPGELWWGAEKDDPDSNRDAVAYLLDQAHDELEEQLILYPELLLASALGKLPSDTRSLLIDRVKEGIANWPDEPELDSAQGAVELGFALLDEL